MSFLSFQKNKNSNEEILIRAQVDEIYQIEEKINLLSEQLNKADTKNIFMKKIEELKNYRNNLIEKKMKLNSVFCTEMKKINDEIKSKYNLFQNMENNITSLKNELISYNTLNFQNLKLRKYILSNNVKMNIENSDNFFLNEKEINDIILEESEEINDSEIKKLKRDIEINKVSENIIINNYKEINSKIEQIQENLKMLKEEKNTTKNELINLISCKESLESIIKLNINFLNIRSLNKLKNNIENNINKWSKPSELFMYELMVIEPNRAANIIADQLFNIFEINIENENSESKDYIKNISSIFSKEIIISFINTELDKFISGKINSYKTINEFLENLSIIITSKFQYANIIISSDTLTIFLSYIFKSLFYDSVINSKIKFVNKDYKVLKKNYKKLIPVLYSEKSKLDTKYQEYKSKTEIIQNQIKVIQKNYKNIRIKKINLTKEEQNYIQICSKANILLKQRNNLEKVIINYESKKNEIKKESQDLTNKINEEINNIDIEIVQINKGMKIEQNKTNEDINRYKQIIKEKYKIINEQLQVYKNKYGSNLDIYNRLINSINNTIKKSNSRQPLIIINNNNINNSNIFSYDFTSNNNNNKTHQIFNDDINISKIDSQSIDYNNQNNSSLSNNISNNNFKKIKKEKIINKALSNINFSKSKKIIKSFNKNCTINNSTISNDYNINDNKNKTFYSMNISQKKVFNKNKKNENYNNISGNYTNDKRYDKYCRYYNNYYKKDINLNLDNRIKNYNNKQKNFSTITNNIYFDDNLNEKKSRFFSHKKNKGIFKRIIYKNQSNNFLNKTDLNKLNSTLQNLKDIISQRSANIYNEENNISNNNDILIDKKLFEKIKPLTKIVFCFYRKYNINNIYNLNNKLPKYNPLLEISPEILCQYPYNFIPCKINLDLNNKNINISHLNQEEDINKINISEINSTIVSSKLKSIIEIHRDYRKYKESKKFKSLEDFIIIENLKNGKLNKDEIEKCTKNKNFNFLIVANKENIYEIIICSYEEFKIWINGLAFLIKNKNNI